MSGKIRVRHEGCWVESYEERQRVGAGDYWPPRGQNRLTVRSLRSARPQPNGCGTLR